MTDDDQVRSLLAMAAELTDDIEPPIRPLLARGRRERKLRAALSVLSVAVIAAAAFALPPIVRAFDHSQTVPFGSKVPPGPLPAHLAQPVPGPSAGQLTHFRWSSLQSSPLGPVSQPALAWTGKDLLELSGPHGAVTRNEGAAFNLATRTWRTIEVPNTIDLTGAFSVWTGQQLLVTNGRLPLEGPAPILGARAGLYDPPRHRWTFTNMPFDLAGASQLTGAWTGRIIVVAGVSGGRIVAAGYDPATRQWRDLSPALPARHPAAQLAMTSTGRRVIAWSLWSRGKKVSANGYAIYSGVDVLALGPAGRWTTITDRWPQRTEIQGPLFAGGAILIPPGQVWCGTLCRGPGGQSRAQLADATTLALTSLPAGPLDPRPGIEPPVWLWNGRVALAADIRLESLSRMAAFDPSSRHWVSLPIPPGHPLMAANPIWAGRQLLLLTASGGLLSFHG